MVICNYIRGARIEGVIRDHGARGQYGQIDSHRAPRFLSPLAHSGSEAWVYRFAFEC